MPCQTVTVEPDASQLVYVDNLTVEGGQNQVTMSYNVINDSSNNITATVRRSVGDSVQDDKDVAVFAGEVDEESVTFDYAVDGVVEVQCCAEVVSVQ